MTNIRKLESVYYPTNRILDYVTEDDIMIFASKSKNFENSKTINVNIIDRENDTIVCWIYDENDQKLFLKLTPFITYIISGENLDINYDFWKRSEWYWQAYLYRLFGNMYMDIIKQRDSSSTLSWENINQIIDKEVMYQNSGLLMWPHVFPKEIGIQRTYKKA